MSADDVTQVQVGVLVEGAGSEVSGRRWGRQGEGDEPATLEPDHPLMKRFQASLREHLLRQNDRLTEEVLELSAGVKLKQQERQTSAEALFNVEQEVARQHSQLSDCNRKFAELTLQRDEMDAVVRESKEKLQAQNQLLADTDARESQLMAETAQVDMLESQLKAWTEQTETDLGATQRMSEKARLDKKQLAADKRKQDWFVFRLQMEVGRLEGELATLQRLQLEKEAERDRVERAASDADAELQRISREQQRLLQSWSRVVVAVHARDKVHAVLHEQLLEQQDKLTTLVHEVESEKKAAATEQLVNQDLTMALYRAETAAAALEREANVREEAKAAAEDKLGQLLAALEETDHDLAALKVETALHESQVNGERKQLERVAAEKRGVEDLLLADMQQMETNDKAATYNGKLITKLRDSIRRQELSLVEAESVVTAAMLACEQQDGSNQSAALLLAELETELANEEAALGASSLELKQAKLAACARQANIEMLHKRLETLVNRAGGNELTPAQVRLAGLEVALKDVAAKCASLQQFWLRREGLTVQLAQQRAAQLVQIDMAQRQLSVLEQNTLTLEQKLAEQQSEQTAISRATEALLGRLQTLDLSLAQARGSTHELDLETKVKHSEYLDTLKACELQWLQLEEELRDLEADKAAMSVQLVAAQRACLAADSRCKMAAEVRATMERETAKDGEVGTMRSEIHRMQVRYSQLRRAQEKLAYDLDHCVSRRDAIVDQSQARERRAGADRKKWNSQLNELRLKLANNQTSTRKTVVALRRSEHDVDTLQAQLALRAAQLNATRTAAADQDARLRDVERRRHINDAQLARRQTKIRQYTGMRRGSHRLLFKTEQELLEENHKQRSITSDLVSALETSLEDLPALSHELGQVLALLRLPPA